MSKLGKQSARAPKSTKASKPHPHHSLIPGEWRHGDIHLLGHSVAGVGTCLVWPELKLAFDVAQGLPYAFNCQHYLLSHCHMDHASGIPYLISQRALMGLPPGRFYMPQSMVEPMHEILNVWQRLDGHNYSYEFLEAQVGEEYSLGGDYFFRPFKTVHRVDSQGYTVFRRRKKLRMEFQGLHPDQLLEIKGRGQPLEDLFDEALVSFTGDTQIEFLPIAPTWVKESRVLAVEVTYMDQERGVEKARQWGHIHLDELLAHREHLRQEKLLLIHLSARHQPAELAQALKQRLGGPENQRFEVFPRRA